MLRRGKPPYLECSTRGFRPFSAFCAVPPRRDGLTIEEIYQRFKKIKSVDTEGNEIIITDLDPGIAKGQMAINAAECRALYYRLWKSYMTANPKLWTILMRQTGLSDMFGKEGNVCQADTLWTLLCEYRREHKVCKVCQETSLANTPEETTTCDSCKHDRTLRNARNKQKRRIDAEKDAREEGS